MAQCTATSKRSGERCKRHASKGRNVCAIHGGKSLVGRDLPQFRHGRYSKYLPDNLAERYNEALANPDLISLEDDIALIESRLTLQLDAVRGAGADENLLHRLREMYGQFRRHTNAGNQEGAIQAITALGELLFQGADTRVAWDEVNSLIEQRRKLVETERKRLIDENQMITVDRLMILVAAIVDIIRRNVVSKEERAAVASEIRLLVDSNPGNR